MQMFPGQEIIIIFQIFYKIKTPHLNFHSSFFMLEIFLLKTHIPKKLGQIQFTIIGHKSKEI